jgi:hypothetical protein
MHNIQYTKKYIDTLRITQYKAIRIPLVRPLLYYYII